MIIIQKDVRLPEFEIVPFKNLREALSLVRYHLSPLERSISSQDTRIYANALEGIDKLVYSLNQKRRYVGARALSNIQYIGLLEKMWSSIITLNPENSENRLAIEKASIEALMKYGVIRTPTGSAGKSPFMISGIDLTLAQKDFRYILKDWNRLLEETT